MTPHNFVLLFSIVFFIAKSAEAYTYYIPFFGLNVTEYKNDTELTLIIHPIGDTDINISGSSTNSSIDTLSLTVLANVRNTYTLSGFPSMNSSVIGSDSLQIKTGNVVTMQVFIRSRGYSEGFMALAKENTGTEYYINTFCALGGFCQITIGTVDSGTTRIYVRPPSSTDEEIMYCLSNKIWKSGRDKVIELIYPETIQITSKRDLSGTYIYADKRMSVLAGTHSVEDGGNVYHFLEQFTSVDQWGKEFVFKTVGNSTYGNIVGITAMNDSTTVTMNGFQNTEMSKGQFINRRVKPDSLNNIIANEPIQVVLFTGFAYQQTSETASELFMTNPGMSLVPAVEHAPLTSTVACLNSGSSRPSIQFTSAIPLSLTNFVELNHDHMPYSDYEVYVVEPTDIALQTPHTFSVTATGFITCEDTALMPLALAVLQVDDTCTPNPELMVPADGIDNNCDGNIDEEYCFENKKVEAVYFEPDGGLGPFVEDISGFRSLKVRVLSICNMTNIHLSNENNDTVYIQITTQSLTISALLPNGSYKNTHDNISDYKFDCQRLYPFWLLQTDSRLCFDMGPVPPLDCTNSTLTVNTTEPMSTMRIGGTFSNVTYWIDISRYDCGNLHSTWRCVDLFSNCSEYGTDVCSSHSIWAQVYCGVYCGLCFPDSYGQVFVLSLPSTSDYNSSKEISIFQKNPQNATLPTIGIGLTYDGDLSDRIVFTNRSLKTINGDMLMYQVIYITGEDTRSSNIYIYSDEDVRVTVNFKPSTQFNSSFPRLFYAVEPLDTAGTEYMTSFFQTPITCHVIAHGGIGVIRKLTSFGSVILGIVDGLGIMEFTLVSPETTGTIIRSSGPVTIFCGNTGQEYTWQQLRPTNTWGKHYVIPPTHGESSIYTAIRIITNSDDTVILLQSDVYEQRTILNKRGDYMDQDIEHNITYTVTSNQFISVGILQRMVMLTPTASSWVVLPPVLNFINHTELFIPNITSTTVTSVNVSSVNILATDSIESFNSTSGRGNGIYRVRQGEEAFMLGEITSVDSVPLFIESTSKFRDLTQAYRCQMANTNAVNDTLDNDCDGLVDEDVCFSGYGVEQSDVDDDGGFGEDCSTTDIGTLVYALPRTPDCVVNTAEPGCWMICDCDCRWVVDLKAYNTMTPQQREIYNYNITSIIIKNLTVDKNTLLSERSLLEATDDDRPSSTSIGYVGYLILFVSVFMCVFFDVLNLIKHLRCLFAKSK